MTNEIKEMVQKSLNELNNNICEMKKEIKKVELLTNAINQTITKIKPIEKLKRNVRK